MVPYMETDTDEGGFCKRFTDLPWIRYGSPTERYGDPRTSKKEEKGKEKKIYPNLGIQILV